MTDLASLEGMGFRRDLAERALSAAGGDVNKASLMLLDQAKRQHDSSPPSAPMRADVYRASPPEHSQAPRFPPDHPPPPRPGHSPPSTSADYPRHNPQHVVTLRPDPVRPERPQHSQTLRTGVEGSYDNHNASGFSQPSAPTRSDSNSNQTSYAGENVRQPMRPLENVRDTPDHAMPQAPTHSNESRMRPPRGPEALTEPLQKRMFVDVRDTLGKWLEAEVIAFDARGNPRIHYIGWESKWDESIEAKDRIASCHKYSSKATSDVYEKGSKVWIWARKPDRINCWVQGVVTKIDGQQVQVEYYYGEKKFQYWYHVHTDEIRSLEKATENKTVSVHPDLTNGTYFEGQFLEVRDNVNWRWRAAEVKRLKPETNEILIHYDGLASSWNEFLHVEKDVARIKPLGADIPDTPEIALAKKEDEEFREGLKSKGMTVVDVERDGNCLFRSVAHQMYNDVSKHAEVRKLCYDYMMQDQEFFSCFIPEDFAGYVARQRRLNEWGDHVEVIALREIFNVNVEVYDKAHFPSPLYVASTEGITSIMRLTFHGHNHYNSLVGKDCNLPLEPSTKVNLKQLRLSKVQTLAASSPTSADTKEDPSLERQNTIRMTFGLGRASKPLLEAGHEPLIADIEHQVEAVIKSCDRKGYILQRDCIDKIVPECLRLLKEAKVRYWQHRGDKLDVQSVLKEYETSERTQSALGALLCQNAQATTPLLVFEPAFRRNLMTLDAYWGKPIQ